MTTSEMILSGLFGSPTDRAALGVYADAVQEAGDGEFAQWLRSDVGMNMASCALVRRTAPEVAYRFYQSAMAFGERMRQVLPALRQAGENLGKTFVAAARAVQAAERADR